jgi:hypothetical protein
MNLDGISIRVRLSPETGFWMSACFLALLGLCAALPAAGGQEQEKSLAGSTPLRTDQVVENLVGMNLRRAQALHSYHGTRTYRIEYRGLGGIVGARMAVDVVYVSPDIKKFTIRSSTGSKLVIDRVFKRLLKAEEDALSKDEQRRAALNCENYKFTLVGYDSATAMYVLIVDPRTAGKYLYHGRVWVDAHDFAVVRLEAEPAQSPSFWTKKSEIEQSYVKVDDFWLPERNHSISSIRLGGRAELTIEYKDYQITAADLVGSAPTSDVAHSAGQRHTPVCSQMSLHHSAETEPTILLSGTQR